VSAVSRSLARQALRLYPLAYRRRYGDEMLALLEERPAGARTVLDLLRAALVAHLRPAGGPAGAVDPADRVRATTSGVLMCWICFAAAGFGFYKSTEDYPFSQAGHAHPVLNAAHLAVQALALMASAAVVLGALPLIAAALAHAREHPGLRRRVLLPLVPVIAFAALTAAFIAIAHSQQSSQGTAAGHGAAIVWAIAGLGSGVACVLACRAALFAVPVAPARLRIALAAGTLVTIAMLAIAAFTAIYAVALAADASPLAGEPNGPFGLLSVSASLIVAVIVMVGAAALAAITTLRGWRGERELEAT
jgi:hypothetical protein